MKLYLGKYVENQISIALSNVKGGRRKLLENVLKELENKEKTNENKTNS